MEGDSIKVEPKKLGLVSGVDIEAVEDADVATLDRVGESLARAIATKVDAKAFSTDAATAKSPAGLLGSFTPLAEAVSVISILKAVPGEANGGRADTAWVSPSRLGRPSHRADRDGREAAVARRRRVRGRGQERGRHRHPHGPRAARGRAVVGEAAQLVVGIGRQVNVQFSEHAKFTSDVVLCKSSIRVDFKLERPEGADPGRNLMAEQTPYDRMVVATMWHGPCAGGCTATSRTRRRSSLPVRRSKNLVALNGGIGRGAGGGAFGQVAGAVHSPLEHPGGGV